jgi:Asp/Glu/hydantoin racemase
MSLVRIINPNSNAAVTEGMSAAIECLRSPGGLALVCETIADGPFGVESLADVSRVEPLLRARIESDTQADAFVIGCYSDPGIHLCREATTKPVFGIQQCAALLAISRGGRFGVISLSDGSVERHLRYLRTLGLEQQCAADRAANLSVAESESGAETLTRLTEVGQRLVRDDGARSVILGCTGMAKHRSGLEAALGVPVIEPTQAATSVAVAAVQMSW